MPTYASACCLFCGGEPRQQYEVVNEDDAPVTFWSCSSDACDERAEIEMGANAVYREE